MFGRLNKMRGTNDALVGADTTVTAKGVPAFLFETVVYDFHATCIQFGDLCARLAAFMKQPQGQVPNAWRHLLLSDEAVAKLALRYSREMGLPEPVAENMRQLYAAMGSTKSELVALLGRNSVSYAELGAIAPGAKRASAEATNVLKQLEPLVRERLEVSVVADHNLINRFMEQVASGRAEVTDGRVNLPERTQRRKGPRARLDQTCAIVVGSEKFAAILNDASQTGLGLHCKATFATGTRLVVQLNDGRRLAGSVRGQREAHVGILLNEMLPLNDPLFRNSARVKYS